MYHNTTGSYDEIPDGMKRYINNYGCHFNKKLCREAASRMYKKVNGRKEYISPYTKEDVENILAAYNITLKRDKLYDAVYVANMCKADFLGNSVPTEEEGYVFNRFYADCMFMNNPIDWEDMV